jgi:hypothetical protein
MGGIFISYRREDTAGYARSLTDALAARFGQEAIFRDVDTLGPGEDFPDAIAAAVAQCDVLVALIGDKWLTAEKAGKRRLDDPRDFVRLEVAAALDRDILVIPVLLEHARMPSAEELPENLVELADRNALRLTDENWQDGVNRLVRAVEARVRPKGATAGPARPTGPSYYTPTPTATPTNPSGWEAAPPAPAQYSYASRLPGPEPGGGGRTALIAGGVVVALLIVGVVGFLAFRGGGGDRGDDGGGGDGGTLRTVLTFGTVPDTTLGRADPPVTVGPLPGETNLVVAPASGTVGTRVTVTGSGFQASERVDIRFHTEQVAQARADARGNFSASFAIPPFPFKGSFDIIATGATSIESARTPFRIT